MDAKPFAMPDWEAFTEDPAERIDVNSARWISTRLSAQPPDGWYAAGQLRLVAPTRESSQADQIADVVMELKDGGYMLIDEQQLVLQAQRIRRHSLDPDPEGTPFLERIRALHVRTVAQSGFLLAHDRYPVSGMEGVLDRFGVAADAPVNAFQLCAVLAEEEGLLVSGAGPVGRAKALNDLCIPLASCMWVDDLDASGFRCRCPPGFGVDECLTFSSRDLVATATVQQFTGSAAEWYDDIRRRGPFARGETSVGGHEVMIEGFGPVQADRFNWQPAGMGPMLTTIGHGVAGGLGFKFFLNVSLAAPGELFLTDPYGLLESIRFASQ